MQNIVRAVDGTAQVIPMPVQGVILARLGDRSAVVPTARAYQMLRVAGLPGITEPAGSPAWKWQCRQVASALLGDWQ